MADEYLTDAQFGERYHVPKRTRERWRRTGEGPPFIRRGPKLVIFRLADCEAWARARTFAHRAAELAARPVTDLNEAA